MISENQIMCDVCGKIVDVRINPNHKYKAILFPLVTKDFCPECFSKIKFPIQ